VEAKGWSTQETTFTSSRSSSNCTSSIIPGSTTLTLLMVD